MTKDVCDFKVDVTCRFLSCICQLLPRRLTRAGSRSTGEMVPYCARAAAVSKDRIVDGSETFVRM